MIFRFTFQMASTILVVGFIVLFLFISRRLIHIIGISYHKNIIDAIMIYALGFAITVVIHLIVFVVFKVFTPLRHTIFI